MKYITLAFAATLLSACAQASPWSGGEVFRRNGKDALRLTRKKNTAVREIDTPDSAEVARISFLFTEIGSWDGSKKNKQDFLHVNVGGIDVNLGTFSSKQGDDEKDAYHAGLQDGIQWTREAISGRGEQTHRVDLEVPKDLFQGNKIGFGIEAKVTSNDEKAGIEDFDVEFLTAEQLEAEKREWNGGDVITYQGSDALLLSMNKPESTKLVDVPDGTEALRINLLFTEVGTWDNSGSGMDAVIIKIGDVDIDINSFSSKKQDDEKDSYHTGTKDSIDWTREAISGRGEQTHKITLRVPKGHFQNMMFTFGIDAQVSSDDEKALIQDFDVEFLTDEQIEAAKREWNGGEVGSRNGEPVLRLTKNKPESTKVVDIPDPATTEAIQVGLLFTEIGGWDDSGGSKDAVIVKIAGVDIDINSFSAKKQDDEKDFYHIGDKDGIKWTREAVSGSGEQTHRVTFRIPKDLFEDKFSFGIEAQVTADDEKAGIEDFDVEFLTAEQLEAEKRQWNGGEVGFRNGKEALRLTKKKPEATKLVDIPDPATTEAVQFSFLFTEKGDWDNGGGGKDAVIVKIAGVDIDINTFSAEKQDDEKDSYHTGTKDGIEWTREAVSGSGEQTHKITIQVPKDHLQELISFGIEIQVTADDEKAAIEDFAVEFLTGGQIEVSKRQWNGGEVGARNGAPVLLLTQKKPEATQIVDVIDPDTAEAVQVGFLFTEKGDWDDGGGGKDAVIVKIGDIGIDINAFSANKNDDEKDSYYTGVEDGIEWTREAISGNGEQTHEITIQVPKKHFQDNEFSFGIQILVTADDEKAIIGDFTVDSLTADEVEAAKRQWKGGQMISKNGSDALQLFKRRPEAVRIVDTPSTEEGVKISFLFSEVGSWDNSGGAEDAVIVKVGDADIDINAFSHNSRDDEEDYFHTGVVGGIRWTREAVFGSGEQTHMVSLVIPKEHFVGSKLAFGIEAMVTADDEKADIEDFDVEFLTAQQVAAALSASERNQPVIKTFDASTAITDAMAVYSQMYVLEYGCDDDWMDVGLEFCITQEALEDVDAPFPNHFVFGEMDLLEETTRFTAVPETSKSIACWDREGCSEWHMEQTGDGKFHVYLCK